MEKRVTFDSIQDLIFSGCRNGSATHTKFMPSLNSEESNILIDIIISHESASSLEQIFAPAAE